MTDDRFFRKLGSLFVDARLKLNAAKASGHLDQAEHWSAIMNRLQSAMDCEVFFAPKVNK